MKAPCLSVDITAIISLHMKWLHRRLKKKTGMKGVKVHEPLSNPKLYSCQPQSPHPGDAAALLPDSTLNWSPNEFLN